VMWEGGMRGDGWLMMGIGEVEEEAVGLKPVVVGLQWRGRKSSADSGRREGRDESSCEMGSRGAISAFRWLVVIALPLTSVSGQAVIGLGPTPVCESSPWWF